MEERSALPEVNEDLQPRVNQPHTGLKVTTADASGGSGEVGDATRGGSVLLRRAFFWGLLLFPFVLKLDG